MAYISPETVQSPKGRVADIDVLYDKGPSPASWSIAKLKWDGTDAIGIRWNGEVDQPGSGTPQSRGNATWFIVPPEIVETVVSAASALKRQKTDVLLAGYREMAADEEREKEADEWSEAMIGDGFEAR
jgi:hypothetical protein